MEMDWKILGHEWAVEALAKHIERKAVRHAYLFTGPQGVGRRTLALRFAQAINCKNSKIPGQPCGVCRNCRLIEQQQHPDLFVIQAEDVGVKLKIEQIRAIQYNLSLAPYEADYRIAVFLRFDEASHQAMNALLKTLEEPPERVILLLTANNEEMLLPTISSRCEILRLRPMNFDQLSLGMQAMWGVSAKQSLELAHISGGRPGYAHTLYHSSDLANQRAKALDTLINLISSSRVGRFSFVEKVYKDHESILFYLQIWLSFWRDVLILAAKAESPIVNLDQVDRVDAIANQFGFERARVVVNSISRTMDLIEKNVNKRLALEVMLLDFPFTNP